MLTAARQVQPQKLKPLYVWYSSLPDTQGLFLCRLTSPGGHQYQVYNVNNHDRDIIKTGCIMAVR